MTSLIRAVVATLLLIVAPALPAAAAAPPAGSKPNVLFIAIDDLRPELGCYGAAHMKTPHIDALAKQGVLFNRAYCQQAVCSPSRSSLLTGRRPDSIRIYDLKTHFRTTVPDVVTLPQHFKQSGYHVQGFGKIYHGTGIEGYVPNLNDELSWSVPHRSAPGQIYGTEEVLAHLKAEKAKYTAEGFTGPELIRRVKGPPWESPDVPDDKLPDGGTTELAVKALGESAAAAAGKPFFLAVGYLKPHLPFVAPKKYFDLYPLEQISLASDNRAPQNAAAVSLTDAQELRGYDDVPKTGPISDTQARELIRAYYAATSYVDAQIGQLMAELDRLKLRDSTIVILWSDHGYHLGEQGLWSKQTNFENSARVPLIVSAPGKPAGAKTESLVELVDIYPTLCELAGLPQPAGLEGTSFVSLLDNPGQQWKTAAFSQYPRPTLQDMKVMGYSIRTDRYRYTEWREQWQSPDAAVVVARELYDHQTDPRESVNLADRPDQAKTVSMLAQQLENGWRAARPVTAVPAPGAVQAE